MTDTLHFPFLKEAPKPKSDRVSVTFRTDVRAGPPGWEVRVKTGRAWVHIGLFKTAEEAVAAGDAHVELGLENTR